MEDGEAGEVEHGEAGDGHGGGGIDCGEGVVEGGGDGDGVGVSEFDKLAVAGHEEEGVVDAGTVEEDEGEDLLGGSGFDAEGAEEGEEGEDGEGGDADGGEGNGGGDGGAIDEEEDEDEGDEGDGEGFLVAVFDGAGVVVAVAGGTGDGGDEALREFLLGDDLLGVFDEAGGGLGAVVVREGDEDEGGVLVGADEGVGFSGEGEGGGGADGEGF